jgi:hypothetical protein
VEQTPRNATHWSHNDVMMRLNISTALDIREVLDETLPVSITEPDTELAYDRRYLPDYVMALVDLLQSPCRELTAGYVSSPATSCAILGTSTPKMLCVKSRAARVTEAGDDAACVIHCLVMRAWSVLPSLQGMRRATTSPCSTAAWAPLRSLDRWTAGGVAACEAATFVRGARYGQAPLPSTTETGNRR